MSISAFQAMGMPSVPIVHMGGNMANWPLLQADTAVVTQWVAGQSLVPAQFALD